MSISDYMSAFSLKVETYLLLIHLFLISTLLGAQLFQCLMANKIAHQALSPTAFRNLQCRLWPEYFFCQLVLGILLALTMPAVHSTSELAVSMGLVATVCMSAAVNWKGVSPVLIPNMMEKAKLDLDKAKRSAKDQPGLLAGNEKTSHKVDVGFSNTRIDDRGYEDKTAKLDQSNKFYHSTSFWINWITVIASLAYAIIFFMKLEIKA